MRTTQAIVDSIDARLRELREEIKALDAARTALDDRQTRSPQGATRAVTSRGGSASGASSRRRTSAKSSHEPSVASAREPAPPSHRVELKTSRRKVSPKAKRASNALPVDRLEALLSGNGGLTTSELATQANASCDQVLGLLRELETGGRVRRRTGQRRATRWHVITDEDRIRERAAELEATRRRFA